MNKFTLIPTKTGIARPDITLLWTRDDNSRNKLSQWRDHHGPTATHLQTKENTSQTSKQASSICAVLAYQCCWLSSAGRVYYFYENDAKTSRFIGLLGAERHRYLSVELSGTQQTTSGTICREGLFDTLA